MFRAVTLLVSLLVVANCCSTNSDCPASESCENGSCTAKVTVITDSPPFTRRCNNDKDCPDRHFCFIGECLRNQTIGGSCRFGMQCIDKDAFCIDGFCACLSMDRFDGRACVRTNNYLILPISLAVASGLTFLIISSVILVVVKRRRAQRARAAAQAGPLPIKYMVPLQPNLPVKCYVSAPSDI